MRRPGLISSLLIHLFLLLASSPAGFCFHGDGLSDNVLTSFTHSIANHPRHAKPLQGSHRRLATGDVLDPDVPAECADALCLVQALLNRRPQIFITSNIDLRGVGILPTIENRASISGVCDRDKCKLDAGGQAGIFVVGLGGYLTLKDLDLTGGFCSRGPAVLVSGLGADSSLSSGKLEALNVKFYNNVATDVGGAVVIESGGSAFVKNSVFYNNKANKGGAVYVGGSAKLPTTLGLPPPITNPSPPVSTSARPPPTDCTLRGCATFGNTEFSRNQADVAGGAVYVDDSTPDCADLGGAQLDCTACTFVNNSAGQDGGAIQLAFLSSGTTANTKESAFISNTAGEDGGDVNVQAGQVSAPGSRLQSYSTVFASSSAPNGLSVAVGPAASGTFTKCDFSSYMAVNSLACEGTCNTTCPVDKAMQQLQGSCADVLPPAPLCPWVPEECPPPVGCTLPLPTPSPPSPSFPLPTPSPPSPPSPSFPSPPRPELSPPISSLPPPSPPLISGPPPSPPLITNPPPSPPVTTSPPLLPPPSPLSNPPPPLSSSPPSPPTFLPPPSPPSDHPLPPLPTTPSPPPPFLSPPSPSSNNPPPPLSTSPSPPSPFLSPPSPSSNNPPPPLSTTPPPSSFLPPPSPSSNNPPPPLSSTPPPPSFLPPPSPSSTHPLPPLPTLSSPPPPPSRRTHIRRPLPRPVHANSTSPPSLPPPPQGQGTINNPPPALPPPPTPSTSLPSPPPPTKKRWGFPPPPQGTGSVENAPPAPPPPPSSSITGDPHFVGKHGERFDFHGKDGKDYCVVSDRDIHMNMHVFHGKLRMSTFISKLGLLYKGQRILVETQISSLHSHAWRLAVDDVELRDVNSTLTRAGLTVTRGSNFVRMVVPGEMDVLAIIIHATFGKRGSLKDYINLQVKELKVSPKVHGLLGQTYKETDSVYEKLRAAKGKKRMKAAEVFIDGSESDYLTSDIMSPDCKYSTFEAQGAWTKRLGRTLFESIQTFLSRGPTSQLTVSRDCVGFGDTSICDA